MAKLVLVAVRDRQLNAFGQIFVYQSRGQAIRAFGDEVNRKDNELNKHPEDYEMYEIGTFNTDDGMLEQDKPQQIAIATNLITRE